MAKKAKTKKAKSQPTALAQLRDAVHQLLNYNTSAPKAVEDRVRELMYGR